MNNVPMEYMLDAAGIVADALLVWWITSGSLSRKTPQENDAVIDTSRS